jgi:2,3-bisphosphoglycerate-dependent phosphoglycerate mutase
MGHLILVRHGAQCFNPNDRFVGWIDIPLSREGIEEVLDCAIKLENIELDLAFASNLVRIQGTLFVILSGQKKTGIRIHEKVGDKSKVGKIKWYSYSKKLNNNLIPVFCKAALNECYYGKLQGGKKRKMEEKYGTERVAFWSWYFETGPQDVESLEVVYERAVSYFVQKVMHAVKDGRNVIVCAHPNSLRALVKL